LERYEANSKKSLALRLTGSNNLIDRLKKIWKRITEFVKKHYILITVIVVPIGAILFLTGMITYNESASFCYTCHINEGPYNYFDKERAVHKNMDESQFTCINCHEDKAVQMIYFRGLKKYQEEAQLVGNLQRKPVVNPKDVYKTEQCLICHPDRLDVEDREPYLLASDELKKLGLRFNKRLHYRFETFNDEDIRLYEELMTKVSLTEDENQELELLNKIKIGNCGQCHIQKKMIENAQAVDKQVNYIARNPISCAGCHEEASPVTHPGSPMKTPTKQVCQKCHHGQIHGKFLIFKADCDEKNDTEHCIKCHPLYKPEMFLTKSE